MRIFGALHGPVNRPVREEHWGTWFFTAARAERSQWRRRSL